jgi:hypothetical protein
MSGFVRFSWEKFQHSSTPPEKFLRFSEVLAVGHSALCDLILIDPSSLGPSFLSFFDRLGDVRF